ncbi:isocitrate lyase/phosphoenolpyruvate mutase family protein [Actinoplanes sp. NPDC051513]|uniref:isocitrate lyase/phosphoenolpyruvate mutase family protein n=1 Tax=Actinoplanes sp. NPDC051513 TaxID=3363908 RepID=UPI0037B6A30A
MTGADELRALLAAGTVTHVPGVYDPVTAALAVAAGHRAVHLSGAAVSALMLGRPDLGFVHATQIADRAATLAPALGGIPLIADADTGYGAPLHAVWTGHAYVRAGISGLHIEDQAQPKRCGHLAGKEVIDTGLAAAKVAALASEVPELAVIARTDAYSVNGLDDVIDRCRAFAAAGADAVFPEGVDALDELARVHEALPGVPIVINRSEAAGNRPAPSDADLATAGVRLVLHPVAALLASLRAASLVYRQIADTGSAEPVDRMPWAAFTALIGQQEAIELDARYAQTAPPGYPSPATLAAQTSSDQYPGFVPPTQGGSGAGAPVPSGGSGPGAPVPSGGHAAAQTPPGHTHASGTGSTPPGQQRRDQREADTRHSARLQT